MLNLTPKIHQFAFSYHERVRKTQVIVEELQPRDY